MVFALHALDREGCAVLAHYFVPVPLEATDAYEAALGDATRPFLRTAGMDDVCLAARGHPVVLRAVNNTVFALSGLPTDDELGLAEALGFLAMLVDATCEKSLSPAAVAANHGKVTVCLREAVVDGRLVHTDVETVLRNAKLKAPALG